MKRLGLFVIASLAGILTMCAAEHYAAPEATARGNGSKAKPWRLQTALAQPEAIKPGDTVWLRGGTYRGAFMSQLTGKPNQPILVRQYPGERATLDCTLSNTAVLTVNGAWTWYWGFEVCNTSPDRTGARGTGLNILGPDIKIIDVVVHDAGVGIGFWSTATRSEIYGCLIYFNGWQGAPTDRGHGHAIYTQNNQDRKFIRENVMFDQFGYGLHAYTEGGALEGFDFEGNVAFNNGVLTREGLHYDNYLIGGFKPARNIALRQNFGYHTPGKGGANLALGYGPIRVGQLTWGNSDVLVESNYLAGGNFNSRYWTNMTVRGNTFALLAGGVSLDPGPGAGAYQWDQNQYFLTGPAAFGYQGTGLSFADWKARTGYDARSRLVQGPPAAAQVFVRRNFYETNRANIIVFNWSGQDQAPVDLRGVLSEGMDFEVRNAQDYYGPAVLKGRGSGQPVAVPMTNLSVAQPIGVEGRAKPTWPEFNVFVVLPVQR
ncbi:MAG: hypothetical protein ABSH34_20165 [Verrucomicrobiota bacterium]|jgi:hypothetical protein